MSGAKCHEQVHLTSRMEMSAHFFVYMSNGVSECVCVCSHLCVCVSSQPAVCADSYLVRN